MIRDIDNTVHFIYDITSIKDGAATDIKYLLRGVSGADEINLNILLKDIDGKVIERMLNKVSRDIFFECLMRHAKASPNSPVVQNLPPENNPCIIFVIDKPTESTDKHKYLLDTEIKQAIEDGLSLEWMQLNMHEKGFALFSKKYEESKAKLLTTSLMISTRERNHNPIY